MTDQIPNITRAIACVAASTLLDDAAEREGVRVCMAIAVLDAQADRAAPTLRRVPALLAATPEHYAQAAAILRDLAPDADRVEAAARMCETPAIVASLRAAPGHDPRLEPFLVAVLAEHPAADVRDLWLVWVRVGDALEELGRDATAGAVHDYVTTSTIAGLTADAQTFTTAVALAAKHHRT